MKKKMDRKVRLRSFAAGCMILFILFTGAPAGWNGPAGMAYAAGTRQETETETLSAAADTTGETPQEEREEGNKEENKEENREEAIEDTKESGGGSSQAGSTSAASENSNDNRDAAGDEAGAGKYSEEDPSGSGRADSSNTADASQTENAAAAAETGEGAETAASDAPGEKETAGSSGSTASKETESPAQNSSDDTANTGKSADTKETAGSSPDAGTGSTAAQTDAAAAATQEQEVIEEEPWMTVSEFNRAFDSVTTGAAAAGTYVPAKATIVSKESEINYEDLGIGKTVDGHPGHTTPVNIRDDEGNDFTGICVVPDDRGLPRWSNLPGIKIVTDAVMIKLYYYTMLDSYGENLAKNKGFGSNAKKVAIAACHEAMSMRYAELAGISYDRPNVGSNLRSLVSAYRSGASSKSLPDMNKVRVYISGRIQQNGEWMQAYVFGFIDEEEPASIVFMKVSSDPDMRNAYNKYYCLHETAAGGTVDFGVYTDKACTKKAKVYGDPNMTAELSTIPVGLSGKSGLWNQAVFYCRPGTYYLKELTTPRGYQARKDPFGPYTVTEGKGLTIKASNTPRYARAGIIKKAKDTGKVLSGAKYGLYADKEDARNGDDPMGVFTTGADGKSNELEVIAGKEYYVREISAPKGYKKDTQIYTLKTAENFTATVWTELTDTPEFGKVQVKKVSSDHGAVSADGSGLYSLEGAVYTLYDEAGVSVGSLKTGKDGSSDILTVQCGTYTLRETAPSPGFALDVTAHSITVTAEGITTVESTEPARKAKILVQKTSSEEKEGKAPDTLPVTGALYGLYNTKEDAQEGRAAAGTFAIREDGSSNELEVIAGRTYYVKETKAPEGYLPDEKIHVVEADSFTETYTVQSVEKLIFGGIKICKRDLETGKDTPLGGASLEGVTFRIYNDSSYSIYADGKKILPGAEAMTLVSGPDGGAETSVQALSYGSYRIEEILAPEGYTLDGAKPVRFNITEDGRIKDLTGSEETRIKDRVVRGDISIRKLNAYTKEQMAGVTFEITSYDREGKELEKHRFTTDEKGCFESTAAWAAQNKTLQDGQTEEDGQTQEDGQTRDSGNAGQAEEDGKTQEDGQTEDGKTQEDGNTQEESGRIWFGVDTVPDDSLGAFPYGAYHIEEIEGENNRGMKMFSDDFSIYEDRQLLSLGNIENTLKPVLETELLDEDGDHFADQQGRVTLIDTVTYKGMEDYIGKEVTFHGVIYVKETGKPLQIDGKTIECIETRKILSHSGAVQLRFTFDASGAQGMTLVCYEYASEAVSGTGAPDPEQSSGDTSGEDQQEYHDSTNGGEDIVSHTDIDDESQTVHLFAVETDAGDQLTGMHIGEARNGAVTVDHVTCKGLLPGHKYLVTGCLVDKADGRPLTDSEGKEVTAKASFTAKESEETVDLTFTYDASLLEGTTVVAFERLYLDGEEKTGQPEEPSEETPQNPDEDTPDNPEEEPDDDHPIAVHEDPDDEDQSVHYPQIRTNAAAGAESSADDTDMKKTVAADGKVVVRDHVTWKNLIPGSSYLLQGSLMCKEDGKAFCIDKEPVTAQVSFTPLTKDGETDLDFTFDASGLFAQESANDDGQNQKTGELQSLQIVAFEELYVQGKDSDKDKEEDNPSGNADSEEETEEEFLVASHKDLEDPAQAVLLREPEKSVTPPAPEKEKPKSKTVRKSKPVSPATVRTSPVKTGDRANIALYLVPALLAVFGIATLFILKRRSSKNKELQ